MKITTVPLSAIASNPGRTLHVRDYIESDRDMVRRVMQAKYPGKNISLKSCKGDQIRVTVSFHVTVTVRDGKIQDQG